MSDLKFAIFPAAGGIGGSTAKHIIPRIPAKNLVFIARNPQKLQCLADDRITLRKADYDDDEALEHAFEGVDVLFLISYASVEYEHRVKRHRMAIECAIRSGVRYIFYGSLGFAGPPSSKESVAYVMKPHLATEQYLGQCAARHDGFDYTIIREGLYSESWPLYTAFPDLENPTSEIRIPHDGSGPGIAWVKREELGEGTAEILARFARNSTSFDLRKQTVLLSGQKTLTLAETVQTLSEITKKPMSIKKVSQEEFAADPRVVPNFTYKGLDLSLSWTTAFEAFRLGEGAHVSPLLKELLGREPEDFKTTMVTSIGKL